MGSLEHVICWTCWHGPSGLYSRISLRIHIVLDLFVSVVILIIWRLVIFLRHNFEPVSGKPIQIILFSGYNCYVWIQSRFSSFMSCPLVWLSAGKDTLRGR